MSKPSGGLSKKQAKAVERAIVGFSILSLVFFVSTILNDSL